MTQLYECDNCDDHVQHPAMTLYVETGGTPMGMSLNGNYTEAYHICKECWDDLDWDDHSPQI